VNLDLYRMADEHVVAEYERTRGVLEVVESGLTLATEVLRAQVAGEPLPRLPRPLPPADAPQIEWLDWAIVSGGLRLATAPGEHVGGVPQAETLFDAAAA
jgi:hypothetical protein